ncbi:MAG: hypothetical protein K2Y15_04420 [Burkholderiaceae bacterium]|nr:hypothetical protein [Burkholderiaceae bacterium]
MSGSKLSEDSVAAGPDAAQDHVLGLTVHSLPEPGQVVAEDAARTRSGRWKMIALMLVCAAPVIASYFTYYVIRPESRRSFGELIEPQRPLPEMLALDLAGATHRLPELKGQWLLLSVGPAACPEACQQQLYFQRQLRELMGREKERVDRVWLIEDAAPVPDSLQPALQGATALRVPADELARWLVPAAGQRIEDHLYVVDPMGNWMMRFPAHMNVEAAAKAKRDLERLLRASSSWDQPGR